METKKQLRATIADLNAKRADLVKTLGTSQERNRELIREAKDLDDHYQEQLSRAHAQIAGLESRIADLDQERVEALETARKANANSRRVEDDLAAVEEAYQKSRRANAAADQLITKLRGDITELKRVEPDKPQPKKTAQPKNEIAALFDGSEQLTAAQISERLGRKVSWQELKANKAVRAVKGSKPKLYYHHKLPKS